MKCYNIIRISFPIFSIIFIGLLDCINVTQYIDFLSHIDSTISNTITFISILIGFISCVYVMILQTTNSYILKLLRDNDLMNYFNVLFRNLMYVGFITVLVLIFMIFVESNFNIFKLSVYIALPLSIYFFISSANIIMIICNIILADENHKSKSKIVTDEDIKM